jgi:hypothetical protein
MSDQKEPKSITPYDGNFLQVFGERIRLILRLMADRRVNFLLKLLPLSSLAYAIWPIDIPTPIDDVALIMFANYMFVEMCPPDVVEEHLTRLRNSPNLGFFGNINPGQNQVSTPPPETQNEVIDGEFQEIKKE